MIEQHLFNGDSAEVLKTLKDNSVDMLATDPPYSIGFMGKDWDKSKKNCIFVIW
jgi:site-specific DNA-methyltransferase (adenine-specific)